MEKKTVLVVEDNRDIAQLVGQLLVAYGCEVVYAEGMKTVEEAVARQHVDLLLLDILLPEEEEDGRKIAAALRKAGHKFPIYFMTGLRPPDVGKEYMGLVNGFLRKPFSLRDLRKLLREGLGLADPSGPQESADRDLMGMMASVATEQEEIRRLQAKLASFLCTMESGGGKGISEEAARQFLEGSARCAEGLERIEESLAEVLELMRGHGGSMLKQQGRGV